MSRDLCYSLGHFHSAASNSQECHRSCCRGNNRAYTMHIAGSGGRKLVGIKNLSADSCYHRGPPVSGFLLVFLLLSSTISVILQANMIIYLRVLKSLISSVLSKAVSTDTNLLKKFFRKIVAQNGIILIGALLLLTLLYVPYIGCPPEIELVRHVIPRAYVLLPSKVRQKHKLQVRNVPIFREICSSSITFFGRGNTSDS